MGVGLSLNRMLDVVINDFGFNIMMAFDRPERTEKLVQTAQSVPGVERAEAWDIRQVNLQLTSGEDLPTQIWAVPPDTKMFQFNIDEGRAFLPEDDRAILVNRKVALDYGLKVGDSVTLSVDGQKSDWTIVGLVINLNNGQKDCFVPLPALARTLGSANRTSVVVVDLVGEDPALENAVIDRMREQFAAKGLNPVNIMGINLVRKTNQYQFNLLVNILLTMAVLAAIVGSLGLAGTMSINVVERGREIGLMRAIGAASPAVAGVFVGEGLLLGVISWMLAVPLSIPGGILFSKALSAALMPLDFYFSFQGAVAWLLIVGVLAVIASLWPALSATRISVRESLAYE
jgi:putative ABC transport system permease protein